MASTIAHSLHSELPHLPVTGGTPPSSLRRPTLQRALPSSGNVIDCPLTGTPRTLCPKDADAFSFDPAFLDCWTMPNDLWMCLPRPILAYLAAVQHAGAAVLTGIDRLEKLRLAFKPGVTSTPTHDEEGRDSSDEPSYAILATPEYKTADSGLSLDILLANMNTKGPMYRARVDSVMTMDSPTTLTLSVRSSMPTSGMSTPGICTPVTPITPASHATPLSSPNALMSMQNSGPFAPLSDAAASREDFFFSCAHDSPPPAAATHEFSTPLDPPESYYAAELRELRSSAVVRLRHAVRRVETEWSGCKRHVAVNGTAREAFEHWWLEKRSSFAELELKVKEFERFT